MIVLGYLDPGTGTVIVQALLGGAAGVAVLFKTMGGRFKRSRKADARTDDASDGDSKESPVPTRLTE